MGYKAAVLEYWFVYYFESFIEEGFTQLVVQNATSNNTLLTTNVKSLHRKLMALRKKNTKCNYVKKIQYATKPTKSKNKTKRGA